MKALFTVFLNASFWGSILILFALILRPVLRKAPRHILCVLWVLVILRLLIPFELESKLSLQPRFAPSQVITEQSVPQPDTSPVPIPTPDLPPASEPVIPDVSPVPDAPQAETPTVKPVPDPVTVIAVVWLSIACVALLYNLISYFALLHKARESTPGADGALESDQIPGAFLLGYWKPKIYLPIGLSQQDRRFIIAHEKAHIRRGDNWWKLLGILCLCIHWYNPLVGLFYLLMCRDIEVACDEQVIRAMPLDERKAYSMALLNCGKRMSGFFVASAAFGEISLKQRIKKVLSYRNPALWVTAIGILLVAFALIGFMTNPVQKPQDPTDAIIQNTTDNTQATEGNSEPTGTEAPEETQSPTPAVCNHSYQAATCGTPQTCTSCGITVGAPTIDHDIQGESCTVCGIACSKGLQFNNNGTYSFVTGIGTCTDANIVVPSTYGGLPVISISQEAFKNCTQITSITLPDSINYIGSFAFKNCSNLVQVHMPKYLLDLGGYCFEGCSKLKSIRVPEGTSNLTANFMGCTALQSVYIPADTVYFDSAYGYSPFLGCTSLTTIVFGGTVEQWNNPLRVTNSGKEPRLIPEEVPAKEVICTDGIVSISH